MAFEMPTKRELAFEAAAAARVIRREAGELGKVLRRADHDAARFGAAAREFYEQHAAHVADVMVLEQEQAREYVEDRIAGLPAKAEELDAWLERLARAGQEELIEICGASVRAVLRDRERRGGKRGA